MKNYSEIITIYDVLSWYASGISEKDILDDFPELTKADLIAVLLFAADREHRIKTA